MKTPGQEFDLDHPGPLPVLQLSHFLCVLLLIWFFWCLLLFYWLIMLSCILVWKVPYKISCCCCFACGFIYFIYHINESSLRCYQVLSSRGRSDVILKPWLITWWQRLSFFCHFNSYSSNRIFADTTTGIWTLGPSRSFKDLPRSAGDGGWSPLGGAGVPLSSGFALASQFSWK